MAESGQRQRDYMLGDRVGINPFATRPLETWVELVGEVLDSGVGQLHPLQLRSPRHHAWKFVRRSRISPDQSRSLGDRHELGSCSHHRFGHDLIHRRS